MNILTFDIEEWALEYKKNNRKEQYAKFDAILEDILVQLSNRNVKATFFCLGELARRFPYVVKKIAEQGHEIGCHSDQHTWLNKMRPEEVEEDTRRAIHSLEDLVGTKVKSYRAPAFSIGATNKWAFEILAKYGIEREASIFPAVRDFGGFAEFASNEPSVISYNGVNIKEFPIPLATIFGKQIAYSGGGYFRFFPFWFIRKELNKNNYGMTYFHIGDLITEKRRLMSKSEYEDYFKESGTIINRYKRYIKANLGTSSAANKLSKLISDIEFMNLGSADNLINWNEAPHIQL